MCHHPWGTNSTSPGRAVHSSGLLPASGSDRLRTCSSQKVRYHSPIEIGMQTSSPQGLGCTPGGSAPGG